MADLSSLEDALKTAPPVPSLKAAADSTQAAAQVEALAAHNSGDDNLGYPVTRADLVIALPTHKATEPQLMAGRSARLVRLGDPDDSAHEHSRLCRHGVVYLEISSVFWTDICWSRL